MFGSLLPLGGWLSDDFGRKQMFLIGSLAGARCCSSPVFPRVRSRPAQGARAPDFDFDHECSPFPAFFVRMCLTTTLTKNGSPVRSQVPVVRWGCCSAAYSRRVCRGAGACT